MSRQFSVIRRAPQLVDIVTSVVKTATENTIAYRLFWASNFDGSFTKIIDCPTMGYLDPTVNQATLEIHHGNIVRIAFDPTNPAYSITNPSASFWLQLRRYNGTTETYTSPPTLLLPYEANHGIGIVAIRGSAPAGADVTGSMQIDLPGSMTDWHIQNEGGNSLYVAFEANGAETQVPKTTDGSYPTVRGTQSSLFVRGSGGTTEFSVTSTRAFPR